MKKWNDLAEELKKEPMILGTRVTGEELKQIHDLGLAVKKEAEGEIIAFQCLWHADGGSCMEMGSFWIKPALRDRKLGSRVLEEIYSIFPRDKAVFVVTKNPKVVHLLRKHNWREATAENWEEVIPFKASCGPCDLVPEKEKKDCPKKAREGECLLFYCRASS